MRGDVGPLSVAEVSGSDEPDSPFVTGALPVGLGSTVIVTSGEPTEGFGPLGCGSSASTGSRGGGSTLGGPPGVGEGFLATGSETCSKRSGWTGGPGFCLGGSTGGFDLSSCEARLRPAVAAGRGEGVPSTLDPASCALERSPIPWPAGPPTCSAQSGAARNRRLQPRCPTSGPSPASGLRRAVRCPQLTCFPSTLHHFRMRGNAMRVDVWNAQRRPVAPTASQRSRSRGALAEKGAPIRRPAQVP